MKITSFILFFIALSYNLVALLDKIYFYDDKFGLAYDKNNGSYGFIDKNLNTKIEYKYEEAFPFDWRGFAKVKKETIYYLIDTLGNEYKLATDIAQLDSTITALDLGDKQLDSFPSVVLENTQLKVLLLNSNQLDSLPTNFGQLKNVTTLNLSDNQLTSLPTNFGELKNVTTLNLSDNQLTSLPTNFGELKNVTTLNLSDNQLTSLPTNFGELKNLKTLRLPNTLSPIEVNNLKLKLPTTKIYYPEYELNKEFILKTENELKKMYPYYFYSLARNDIFRKAFNDTETNIKKGFEYDPNDKELNSLLAPALLFQGKYKEAMQEYVKWKNKEYAPKRDLQTFKDAFLADFKDFEFEFCALNLNFKTIKTKNYIELINPPQRGGLYRYGTAWGIKRATPYPLALCPKAV
jgi:hypothetical protein